MGLGGGMADAKDGSEMVPWAVGSGGGLGVDEACWCTRGTARPPGRRFGCVWLEQGSHQPTGASSWQKSGLGAPLSHHGSADDGGLTSSSLPPPLQMPRPRSHHGGQPLFFSCCRSTCCLCRGPAGTCCRLGWLGTRRTWPPCSSVPRLTGAEVAPAG